MNPVDKEPDVIKNKKQPSNSFHCKHSSMPNVPARPMRIVVAPLNKRGVIREAWPEVTPPRQSTKDPRDERDLQWNRSKKNRVHEPRRNCKHNKKFDATKGYPGEGPSSGYDGPTDCLLASKCERKSHSHWTPKPKSGKRRRDAEAKEGTKPESRNTPTICKLALHECEEADNHFHQEDVDEHFQESEDEETQHIKVEELKDYSLTSPLKASAEASASSSHNDVKTDLSSASCKHTSGNPQPICQPATPPPLPSKPLPGENIPPKACIAPVPPPKLLVAQAVTLPVAKILLFKYTCKTRFVNLYHGDEMLSGSGFFNVPKLSTVFPFLFNTSTAMNSEESGEEVRIAEMQKKTWFFKKKTTAKKTMLYKHQILANSYSSMQVVEIFSEMYNDLYQNKNLTSRKALDVTGKMQSSFLQAVRHIASESAAYKTFRDKDFSIYDNTIRYVFNAYVVRDLTDSLLTPRNGLAQRPDFRRTGRYRITQRLDQRFE
jgi:hypothetical protein